MLWKENITHVQQIQMPTHPSYNRFSQKSLKFTHFTQNNNSHPEWQLEPGSFQVELNETLHWRGVNGNGSNIFHYWWVVEATDRAYIVLPASAASSGLVSWDYYVFHLSDGELIGHGSFPQAIPSIEQDTAAEGTP